MKRPFALILLIFLFLLTACSPAATPAPAYEQAAEATVNQAAAKGGSNSVAYAPAPTLSAGAPQAAQATQPPGKGDGTGQNTSPLAFSPAGSQLVIKDAQLELLVQDTAQALNRVTALAGDEGGYIISSQTWYQDGYLYASLRLGIPSLRFENSLNELRRLGLSVLKENAQGQDVTDQYVDLQSRLTNLEATAGRVREFLKSAKTIEDSLRINQQLADLEGQIEQVKGQMHFFEGRAAYSTVTVSLTPQYPTPTPTLTPTMLPTRTPTPPWNPGVTFNHASTVAAKQFQSFVDACIWIGIVLGPWVLLLLLAYLVLKGALRKGTQKAR